VTRFCDKTEGDGYNRVETAADASMKTTMNQTRMSGNVPAGASSGGSCRSVRPVRVQLHEPGQRRVCRAADDRRPRVSNTVFGFGAGIFFVGYFLLQIPSTLLTELWSARNFITLSLIVWARSRRCAD
jgi:hypothetical protein